MEDYKNYKAEGAAIIFFFMVIANYYYGKDINKNIALAFMRQSNTVFLDNFSHVGVTPNDHIKNGAHRGQLSERRQSAHPPFLYEESPYTYQFWASGRKNMFYCKVEVSVYFFGKLVFMFIVKKEVGSYISAFLEYSYAY